MAGRPRQPKYFRANRLPPDRESFPARGSASAILPVTLRGLHAEGFFMRYLHTMVRVSDLEASLAFYCGLLGLVEIEREDNEAGRYTLVFLAAPDDVGAARGPNAAPMLELTHNWDESGYEGGRNFGHLAFRVADIHAACARLMAGGVTINRPPRDGHMAFVRSPDGISIELLQDGALAPQEPWISMPNSGSW